MITRLLISAPIVAMGIGCTTTHIPPRLTPTQQRELEVSNFPAVVVGVECDPRLRTPSTIAAQPGERPLTIVSEQGQAASRLIVGLRATHLFKEVDYTDQLQSPPDLVATPLYFRRAPFHETWLWFFTFGLIPDCNTVTRGYLFSLRRPGRSETIEVDALSRDLACIGWCALVLNPLPNWAVSFPEDRLYGRLALELLAKRPDMDALLDAANLGIAGGPNTASQPTPKEGAAER